MGLPFTQDQFLGVFAEYNRAFWPIALAWWLGTACLILAVRRDPVRRGAWLTYGLGAMWAWNAVAYHAWLFTRINPAAWLFAAAFAAQALILIWTAARRPLTYFSSSGPLYGAGVGLVFYAFAYPLLTIALGHRYPATPTFGVPCPTDILTIGLLLTAPRGARLSLALIPILWGLVGGSAALILGVRTDYVLLAAVIPLAIASARRS